jgi:hypothetical protein
MHGLLVLGTQFCRCSSNRSYKEDVADARMGTSATRSGVALLQRSRSDAVLGHAVAERTMEALVNILAMPLALPDAPNRDDR